ncbi:hypothetical protein LSA2308_00199 [Staphylococcus phage LSA2308]|nr:hypothetical protein LSA2308_00019 [Staphylococcus phage LSA2308]QQO38219.1 hypothetical protein LSA2308_00199 [Staphylococcus phage LSA2308]USZ62813.1 hypothetical protein LSA2311_orf00005 [Staphylococcus phage LSA2311]USZ62991.1 hypothetical protein LSA2311_orf00184 [Staphylococcus phage LSA2311]
MDMNKEVLERLDSLGGKLEQAGTHGYESLIKYTVTQGIIDLCSISILLSITAILWVALYKSDKKSNEGHSTLLFEFVYKNEKELSAAGCTVIIFAVTLSIISFLVLLIGLPIAIQEIFNPEGYLIKSTIDSLK